MADDELPLEQDEQQVAPAVDPLRPQKAERKRQREQREADEFWRDVLAKPVGRREVWNLLQSTHAFETRFACGPNGFPQAEATFHALGEQGVGLRLYQHLLALDPIGIRQMHLEHDTRFSRFVEKDGH